MYKLMIVDDDEVIREHLKLLIPMEKLGLELCCEAADGEEALELYEQLRPQVVVTDINIPLVDGLEFARRVLDSGWETGVIIITGFGTLDFAREAIKSGISGFLLKPLDPDELEAALARVVEGLNARAAEYRERSRMESLLREGMSLLRERYIGGLLSGAAGEDEGERRAHLERLGVTLDGGFYCVAALVPDYSAIDARDTEIAQVALENIVLEVVRGAGLSCALVFDSMFRVNLIAGGAGKNVGMQLENRLSVSRDKIKFYFSLDFYASVGCVVDSLSRLHESRISADRALGYRNLFGNNNIVNSELVRHVAQPRGEHDAGGADRIIESVLAMDEDAARERLQEFFVDTLAAAGGSEAYAKHRYVELLCGLLSGAGDSGIDADGLYETDPYIEILLSPGLSRAQAQIADISERLMRRLRERRSSRNCRLVEQAKRFIAENLCDPELSLAMVSESIGVSSIYFCTLFKSETGLTFTEHLNRSRVKRAKELLASTNMRVYEIAFEVGYLSPKYFFQVFKRVTGKRPREYSQDSQR